MANDASKQLTDDYKKALRCILNTLPYYNKIKAIQAADLGEFVKCVFTSPNIRTDKVWVLYRWLTPKQVNGNFKLLYIFVPR